MGNKRTIMSILLILAFVVMVTAPTFAQDDLDRAQWCEGVTVRFFAGGTEGDAFAGIVYRGALAAERDLAPTRIRLLRLGQRAMRSSCVKPSLRRPCIAMMGHPGNEAIMPLAAEAAEAGIIMMYQNVDVDQVRARYGGGYVGAQLAAQGRALGEEALRQFGFGEGDQAIVLANLAQRERALRELGTWEALEDAGMEIIHVDSPPTWAADPNLGIPSMVAAITGNPDVKLVAFSGGQTLGNTQTYLEAAGLEAGQVKAIGFDTNEFIMQGFADGWIHLTADQQPFLQGYLPVLSICQTAKFGLAPLNADTGAGFIDVSNYEQVKELAIAGYR